MTINDSLDAQEKLADVDASVVDDSGSVKDITDPIDRDTPTYSPTKGMLSTADEIISEAEYNPPKEKIAKKALKKLKEKSPDAEEVLNFQPTVAPEKDDIVKAAEARVERAAVHDNIGKKSKEYAAAIKHENEMLNKANLQSMKEEEAHKILEEFQSKIDKYNEIDVAKNEQMSRVRKAYEDRLNKIIEDDTISWTKRKKLLDKTGLVFGHIMQNIGATMHNIANPNNWIDASDPITLRMGQNLANTIKNRQTNNDTYINNQVEYWKSVLPEYYDVSKIKQRLGNSRILNTYKRLDNSAQRMIMSLAASDAWDTVSDNAILVYMDKLQNGEFTSVSQMLTGLAAAALTSSGENMDKLLDKFIDFASAFVDPSVAKQFFNTAKNALNKTAQGVKNAADGVGNAVNNVSSMFSPKEDDKKAQAKREASKERQSRLKDKK